MLHTILTFLSFEGNKGSQLIFIHFHVVGSFIENWNSCIIYLKFNFLSVWWFKKAEQYFSIVGGDFFSGLLYSYFIRVRDQKRNDSLVNRKQNIFRSFSKDEKVIILTKGLCSKYIWTQIVGIPNSQNIRWLVLWILSHVYPLEILFCYISQKIHILHIQSKNNKSTIRKPMQ